MEIRYRIITLLFLFVSVCALGQNSYMDLEETSRKLYINQDWEKLASYGEEKINQGLGYYDLALRTGIAYYNLKQYEKAIPFFEKALENNPNDEIINEYLFWSNVYLKDYSKTDVYFKHLNDTVRNKIAYRPSKLFDFVYVETGAKLSNNPQKVGNVYYGNIGLNHRFSQKFGFYHSYNYFSINREATKSNTFNLKENIHQQNYYIAPILSLKEGFVLKPSLNYAGYSNEYTSSSVTKELYNVNENSLFLTNSTHLYTTNNQTSGQEKINLYMLQLGVEKWLNKLYLMPYFNYSLENYSLITEETNKTDLHSEYFNNSTLVSTYDSTYTWNSPINYSKKSTQLRAGIDLKYLLLKNRLRLGIDASFISNEGNNYINAIPSVEYFLNSKLSIMACYVRQNNYVISLFNNSQLFNTKDKTNKVISLISWKIDKNNSFYFSYQYEKDIQFETNIPYNYNSFIFGLKHLL